MKTFAISDEVVKEIMAQYEYYLETEPINNDRFRREYLKHAKSFDGTKLKNILEDVFSESLQKEEDRFHGFSVMVSPPKNIFNDLLLHFRDKTSAHGSIHDVASFKKPLAITLLHKIAPAFEGTDRKLQVWFDEKMQPYIWGFASNYFDYYGLEITALSPGEILVHTKPQDFPRKRYLMTFSDTKCVIGGDPLQNLLFKSVENIAIVEKQKKYGFFIDLINKIRSHNHGGILLIIPDETTTTILRESIKSPILFELEKPYTSIKRELTSEGRRTKEHLLFGQFSAIDGATLITNSIDLIAFGVKIKPKTTDLLDFVLVTEPFENCKAELKDYSEVGTRHQSAAQFVFDQKENDAFAVVVSQDGNISIVFWDANFPRVDGDNMDRKGIITVFRRAQYLFYGVRF